MTRKELPTKLEALKRSAVDVTPKVRTTLIAERAVEALASRRQSVLPLNPKLGRLGGSHSFRSAGPTLETLESLEQEVTSSH